MTSSETLQYNNAIVTTITTIIIVVIAIKS